ncbi:protein-glutamate O-methyltransferase CheR, partial [bacterium]|nr:protein-glutamate O-methyltransferase CheR [bacterium]
MLQITDSEFNKIREIMYEKTGVFLRDSKQALVTTRLRSRLEELKLVKFEDYISYINKIGSNEIEYLINAITTNETYFFRCSNQVEYLIKEIIPDIIKQKRKSTSKQVYVWSAGCSNGPEPYTIAMILDNYFHFDKDIEFIIYATDINSEVLKEAEKGVYTENALRETPQDIREKYFIEKEDSKHKKIYEVSDKIKKRVKFFKHNLKDSFVYPNMDIVFLRNVLIYFDFKSR